MKVVFKAPICKTGAHCDRRVALGRCCMDDPTVNQLVHSHAYEAIREIVIDGVQYYELNGWGCLRFNAQCFAPAETGIAHEDQD